MFCSNCGVESTENAKFCVSCGQSISTDVSLQNHDIEPVLNQEEAITNNYENKMLEAFIGKPTKIAYYTEAFQKFEMHGYKPHWSWWGFFGGEFFLINRKAYKYAVIVIGITLLQSVIFPNFNLKIDVPITITMMTILGFLSPYLIFLHYKAIKKDIESQTNNIQQRVEIMHKKGGTLNPWKLLLSISMVFALYYAVSTFYENSKVPNEDISCRFKIGSMIDSRFKDAGKPDPDEEILTKYPNAKLNKYIGTDNMFDDISVMTDKNKIVLVQQAKFFKSAKDGDKFFENFKNQLQEKYDSVSCSKLPGLPDEFCSTSNNRVNLSILRLENYPMIYIKYR